MDIQGILRGHEYMWLRRGAVALPGDVIGYRNIAGLKSGQEIWINNSGLPERPLWLYKIYVDGKQRCCNKHFESAEDALAAAYEWLKTTTAGQLRIRRFKWHGGYEALTVDGLLDCEDVYIVELTSGDWRFRMIKNGAGWGQWYGSWASAEDALAAYRN